MHLFTGKRVEIYHLIPGLALETLQADLVQVWSIEQGIAAAGYESGLPWI
jgi:hypothetical protein